MVKIQRLFAKTNLKIRVCGAKQNNESPSGAFKRPNGLAQQDGGALPRQVLRLPGRMRTPRLCCGIKHTKSENLPPYAPQSSYFDLLSLFSSGAYPPLSGGYRAAIRPSGRERRQDAPQKGACIPAMRPKKSTQKGTFVWFGRVGRVNSSSRTFLGCCFGSGAADPYIFTGPQGAAQPELRRVWRSAKETCL